MGLLDGIIGLDYWMGFFLPNSDGTRGPPGHSSQGPFVPEMTPPWMCGTLLRDCWMYCKCERRGKLPGAGFTKVQPVMFDMHPFGQNKKSPGCQALGIGHTLRGCRSVTKYQVFARPLRCQRT